MGILDRHLIKEILTYTLFAVIVLCGVFLMGAIFKEARPLLVGRNPSILVFLQFVWTILPLSLMFMIPCGFLTSILIVIGRLSSNNEIVAMKMAGRGLYRIALPIFTIALLFCVICFNLNSSLAPDAKALQKKLLYEAVQADPNSFLDPGVVRTQLNGQIVFVEERVGNDLFGLHLFSKDKSDATALPLDYTYARKANLVINEENKQLKLRLYDAAIASSHEPGFMLAFIDKKEPLIFDFGKNRKKAPKVTEMTSDELTAELAMSKTAENKKRYNSLTNELTGRYAFSLSCIAFAFIGVPLAITSKRKESSTGFVISIVVAFLYFSFFLIAKDKIDESPEMIRWIYWAPNIIAILLGCYLFKRTHKR